jgi:hypothetical protein
MNYPAASYGVSKTSIRNRPFAASCGELTRMRLNLRHPNAFDRHPALHLDLTGRDCTLVLFNNEEVRHAFYPSYVYAS